MVDVSGGIWVPHRAAVLGKGRPDSNRHSSWWTGEYILSFFLMNPCMLFALFTILSMCRFQETLFDMSMPRARCVA